MCAPNFVNLNNTTFLLKALLFSVHLRSQQKRTESNLQLSNLQCYHFDIVILRVAVISHVQNVCLHRRHRPTDDASTRRWRASQLTGPVRRSRSFKVTDFGTNRKLICDFLLVINTNLAPILHRFRDIAN